MARVSLFLFYTFLSLIGPLNSGLGIISDFQGFSIMAIILSIFAFQCHFEDHV